MNINLSKAERGIVYNHTATCTECGGMALAQDETDRYMFSFHVFIDDAICPIPGLFCSIWCWNIYRHKHEFVPWFELITRKEFDRRMEREE